MATRTKKPTPVAAPKVSSPSDFKKKMRTTLELPSGMVVQVKNPGGMQTYLAQGKVPNTLMPMVQQGLKSGGVDDESMTSMAEDPKAIADMMVLVDMMVVDAVYNPDVQPAPEDEEDRDEEVLYIDELSEADRMFVFNWVNSGVADLAPFRQK